MTSCKGGDTLENDSVFVSSLAECQKLQEEGYELFAVSEWVHCPDSKLYHLRKSE